MSPDRQRAGCSRSATLGGLGALVLWSTTIALARSLSEQLGSLGSAAAVYGVSGLASLIPLLGSGRRRRELGRLPARYLVGCGLLFVGYMALLFLALGVARDRTEALTIGLVNQLWVPLTLLLSIVILGKRASWLVLPGTLLALVGIVLVVTHQTAVSPLAFLESLRGNPLAYSLAFGAAVTWALYSNLTARWGGAESGSAVSLFLVATALVLLVAALLAEEERHWSVQGGMEAVFLGLATFFSYAWWENAMRKGNVVLVAACSYGVPFLSTLTVCVYLGVAPELRLWIGCAALVLGSLLSWWSLTSREVC